MESRDAHVKVSTYLPFQVFYQPGTMQIIRFIDNYFGYYIIQQFWSAEAFYNGQF